MKRIIFLIGLFLAGMVFTINLVGLVSINPEYSYSWGKMVMAIIVAIVCSFIVLEEKQNG